MRLRNFQAIVPLLMVWYEKNKISCPWTGEKDPYRVWIAEIMLQQTVAASVVTHYTEWLRKFPDVRTLAGAGENEIIRAWEGLGYYARARKENRQNTIPQTKKRKIKKIKNYLLLFVKNGRILVQRNTGGRFCNLFSFPKKPPVWFNSEIRGRENIQYLRERRHLYTDYRERLVPVVVHTRPPAVSGY